VIKENRVNQSEGLIVAEEARLKEETRTDCPPNWRADVRQTGGQMSAKLAGRCPPNWEVPAFAGGDALEAPQRFLSSCPTFTCRHLPVGIYLSAFTCRHLPVGIYLSAFTCWRNPNGKIYDRKIWIDRF
jgi:hypothetical protein